MGNAQDSLATVRANCMNALKHAHLRKTYKGVAEIVVQAIDTTTEVKGETMNDD